MAICEKMKCCHKINSLMVRKVFLSFLGNNAYQQCCYMFGTYRSRPVRFIQEALLDLVATTWTKTDKVFLFLTPEAAQNNWEGEFYDGAGLKKALSKQTHLSIHPITNLPLGLSTDEIWQLFEQLYQCLEEGDEVYLDITNGFRSLPMLLMVLLDYAKALKNIHVQKIFYGAFEATRPNFQVTKDYPQTASSIAPILDLTSLTALQDWTAAAADFRLYGKTNRLQKLSEAPLTSVLQNLTDKATASALLQGINHSLNTLIPLIQTNRGKALATFSFTQLAQQINTFAQKSQLIKPLPPILQEIQKKLAVFVEGDALYWLKTAKWCQEHGLIQQSITQLQEGFVTWLCRRFKQQLNIDFFDYTQGKPRQLIHNTFKIWKEKIGSQKWKNVNKSNKALTRVVAADPIVQQTADCFIMLSHLRNDINHGGYQHHLAADRFSQKLEDAIVHFTQLLERKTIHEVKSITENGLLNISAFPSTDWSKAQQTIALNTYGAITDWDFPEIAPTLDVIALESLVNDYYQKIKALQPSAVHLIGELSFTFKLVEMLKAINIPCICSIWNGRNTNDLNDTAASEFVQFRRY